MTPYIIVSIIALATGFFIGVLFAKRNPDLTKKIDEAYLKGKKEASNELEEKFAQAEEIIKSKAGSNN